MKVIQEGDVCPFGFSVCLRGRWPIALVYRPERPGANLLERIAQSRVLWRALYVNTSFPFLHYRATIWS